MIKDSLKLRKLKERKKEDDVSTRCNVRSSDWLIITVSYVLAFTFIMSIFTLEESRLIPPNFQPGEQQPEERSHMHLTWTFTPEQDIKPSELKGVDLECCNEKQLESLFDAAVHSIHKACSPDSHSILIFESFDRLKNQIEVILALWPMWRGKLGPMWEKYRMGEVEEMESDLCLEGAATATATATVTVTERK